MTTDIIEGTISALSFGGEGILRHEGYVLFVPFTAVGDEVRVRITERKKRFGRAVLEEIKKPSQKRIAARCPYFGTCGGCQLQHLSSQDQLEAKVTWLQDAFTRIGHLPWTFVPQQLSFDRLGPRESSRGSTVANGTVLANTDPFAIVEPRGFDAVPAYQNLAVEVLARAFAAKEAWYYRRHIRLTLHPKSFETGTEGYLVGYQGQEPNTFVPIQQCALFLPQDDPLFMRLQQLLKTLQPDSLEKATLSLMKLDENRLFCHYLFPQKLSTSAFQHLLQNWQCDTRLVGLSIETPTGRKELGETLGHFSFDGLKIQYSPYAFVQTHPTQSALLYTQVQDVIHRLAPRTLLDLYCGIGVTSLIAARGGARVIGIENNPTAILCANQNRIHNHLSGVEFICADVADILSKQLRALSPDLVLINPPRTGLSPKVLDALLKHPPRALLYISCMPPTMARDLAPFEKLGFAPTDCAVIDLFPQTTHMETLLLLQR